MALEHNKSRGAVILAGLSVAGFFGLDRLNDAGEVGASAEVVVATRVDGAEEKLTTEVGGIRSDVRDLFKFPAVLPALNVSPEAYEDKQKRFLGDVDRWLHVAAEEFDPMSLSEIELEMFKDQKGTFDAKVEVTTEAMRHNSVFQARKLKVEAVFPNYELVSEEKDDGTLFAYLIRKPGLVNGEGKTTTGFMTGLAPLEDWKITDLGGSILLEDISGIVVYVGNTEELIVTLGARVKNSAAENHKLLSDGKLNLQE